MVAGVIFAGVALFHLVRIFAEWTVIIGDALVIAAGLPFSD
jgi:hypothetical protein